MRTEALGPKTGQLSLAERIIARGHAEWERYKRGEVKLPEEEPAGQTQEPKQLRLSDLGLIQIDPYIG